MKILYLTNIHNPYRDEFFEQLGLKCDLTVLFEERSDSARDDSWSDNAHAQNYREFFLPDGERGPISPVMLNVIGGGWSLVVVGCYNSPKQMMAIEHMRRRHMPYVVNLDGPLFSLNSSFKRRVRRHLARPDEEKIAFSNYLRHKAAAHTIENMVSAHLELFEEVLL